MNSAPVNDQIRMLIEDVSFDLDVAPRLVFSKVQTRRVQLARNLSYLLAFELLRAKQLEIARAVGRSKPSVVKGMRNARAKVLSDVVARGTYHAIKAKQAERTRLALIGELELMNRTIARYRRRSFVIRELLGLGKATELESEAAE